LEAVRHVQKKKERTFWEYLSSAVAALAAIRGEKGEVSIRAFV
jgi:hypothetical protein